MTDHAPSRAEPTSVAGLHLPPTFVVDHCIRTLAYHGALMPGELARHWRVQDSVATEVTESLKASGFIELAAAKPGFERSSRLRLTAAGEARVEVVRRRTWYAGPLPVSMREASDRMSEDKPLQLDRSAVERALCDLAIDAPIAMEIGQAVGSGATLALSGIAGDEQMAIAQAIGTAISGEVTFPYALFASGAIVRLFDARYHVQPEQRLVEDDDILRNRETVAQWLSVMPPIVTLAGGIQPIDVAPAFDDAARFYLAPPPFAARGGLLAVLDSDESRRGLAHLARYWLMPGQRQTGVMPLRTGERIEVPWRAATVLLSVNPLSVEALEDSLAYSLDASALGSEQLVQFLSMRLQPVASISGPTIESIAAILQRASVHTRPAAARAATYLRDRAAYEGDAFSVTPSALEATLSFAASASGVRSRQARAA